MVKILTPAYGTALNYGSGIRVEAPLFAATVFTNEYRRMALFHKTAEFLAMGIGFGKSIDGIVTHTMRCSKNFVPQEEVGSFNQAAVQIAKEARTQYGRKEGILIIGDMSVMGDCYSFKSVADSVNQAVTYHLEQAKALVDAGVDVLLAETVGNVLEAKAFVQVADELNVPIYISFVLDPQGNILDGTSINEAIKTVDVHTVSPPIKYLTNCSWETQVEAMYSRAEETGLLHRLGGFYNNASNITHDDKQELGTVQRYDSIQEYIVWVRHMVDRFSCLREEDVWISGCCGFGADDIDQLVKELG